MDNTTHYELTMPSSGITTRIALLSMLSLRPMHGYELRQVMEARHMHRWANIQYGSIYRGLQQLAREGLLAEDGEERDGNRPTRTIYRITEAGSEELRNLLRKALSEPHMFADPIDTAMRLMIVLPDEEVAGLLRQRITALQDMINHTAETCSRVQGKMSSAPAGMHQIVGDLFDHRRYVLEAEINWTRHVLERLEQGAYRVTEAEIEQIRRFATRPSDPAP